LGNYFGTSILPKKFDSTLANSFGFERIGRLRQSSVAQQHVSAHFEILRKERSIDFLIQDHHVWKIFDGLRSSERRKFSPLATLPLRKKIIRVKKQKQQTTIKKHPKSIMAH